MAFSLSNLFISVRVYFFKVFVFPFDFNPLIQYSSYLCTKLWSNKCKKKKVAYYNQWLINSIGVISSLSKISLIPYPKIQILLQCSFILLFLFFRRRDSAPVHHQPQLSIVLNSSSSFHSIDVPTSSNHQLNRSSSACPISHAHNQSSHFSPVDDDYHTESTKKIDKIQIDFNINDEKIYTNVNSSNCPMLSSLKQ